MQIRELREANKNPFAYNFQRTHFANELQEEHKDVQNGTVAELQDIVSVAGRIRARRVMGKLAFLSLQDDSGFIQIYVDKKQIDSDEAGSFAWESSAWSVDHFHDILLHAESCRYLI